MHRSRGDGVHEILGAIRPVRGKMGARTTPSEPEFFVAKKEMTFLQLPNGRFSPSLATNRESKYMRMDFRIFSI